jgi:uncharacterized protein (DUF1697 family)
VALLRGINVGGRNRLAMSDLRDLLAAIGLTGGKTLLQSGNLVFGPDPRAPDELERLLERETHKRLQARVDYFVRTADEWDAILSGNPFPAEATDDPSHLLVMFFKRAPNPANVDSLRKSIKGPEYFRVDPRDGRHLYIVYPQGIGRSKFTHALIEKHLATPGSARNWNTLLKLATLPA